MSASAYFNGRVGTAVVMLAIFVTMSIVALGFPEKARLMPLLFGIPGAALALLRVVVELRLAGRMPREESAADRPEANGERQMLAWLGLFLIGILAFGFLYAAPLLVLGFLWLAKKESLVTGIAGAAGTWAVLYGLFERAFEIQLFEGFVRGLLGT